MSFLPSICSSTVLFPLHAPIHPSSFNILIFPYFLTISFCSCLVPFPFFLPSIYPNSALSQ